MDKLELEVLYIAPPKPPVALFVKFVSVTEDNPLCKNNAPAPILTA